MKRAFAVSLVAAAGLLLGSGVACSSGDDDGDAAGADLSGAGENCEMFIVKDQKFVDLKTFVADPARAKDEVVQRILKPVAEGKAPCPTSYTEIQKSAALKSCTLETRIISERSLLLNAPDIGRALASRSCAGGPSGPSGLPTPNVLFLIDPIRADKDSIPPDVELISNNATDGVFSFYAREPKRGPRDSFDPKSNMKEPSIWKFYGTSDDFVGNGYDCDLKKFHGACQSKFAQDGNGNASGVRCASCHPGGGMVQKELNSPWTNWQQDPGGYTTRHKDVYGEFQKGVNFEGVTDEQNDRWDKRRVEVLAKKSVKELLRPLFCTMDINLQAGGSTAGVNVSMDLLADQHFRPAADEDQPFIPLLKTNYAKAIGDVHQVIKADPPFPAGKTFPDTPDAFMYPERGTIDTIYVDNLIESKKVSDDLVRDILFVDFTRPIYSPLRCSLAELADGITDPTKAKDELIKKLTAKSGRTVAENAFLASLQATDPAPRHQKDVEQYFKACTSRGGEDNAGFAADVVKYASHLRQVTKLMKVKLKTEDGDFGILDFEETVPFTDLSSKPVVEMKFNPTTCVLEEEK